MNEPIGTIGILCPAEAPLLGFVSTVMPAIAVGNTVVAVPSELYPLITADLYQLFETSDLPARHRKHSHRPPRRTPQNPSRTRRRRRPLVLRRRPHLRHSKSSFHRQPKTNLHQRRPRHRLVQPRPNPKAASSSNTPPKSKTSGSPTANRTSVSSANPIGEYPIAQVPYSVF